MKWQDYTLIMPQLRKIKLLPLPEGAGEKLIGFA
jgi:hypothetical protein